MCGLGVRGGPQRVGSWPAGEGDATCLPHRLHCIALPCVADVDVSYTTKPLWASYLRYIEDGGADAAMAHETSGGCEWEALPHRRRVQGLHT